MNISLTPELEQYVYDKVKSGRYVSTSEVVRDALRLMEERDRFLEVRLEALRKQTHTDSEQESPEELMYGEEVFNELWDDILQSYPGNKSS
jgi:antitoxin ParD1/3/4